MSETASLTVTGMKCGGCESNIVTKVSSMTGVVGVQAFHKENRVEVEFDPAQTSLDDIEDVITEAGFSVD